MKEKLDLFQHIMKLSFQKTKEMINKEIGDNIEKKRIENNGSISSHATLNELKKSLVEAATYAAILCSNECFFEKEFAGTIVEPLMAVQFVVLGISNVMLTDAMERIFNEEKNETTH